MGRGNLVIVQEQVQHVFKVSHPAFLYLGMFDRDPDDFLVVYGLDLEDTFSCGEQDVSNDGFGRDGQLVQPSAAEPCDGASPDYKVASLARAGEFDWNLSAVGRGIHA